MVLGISMGCSNASLNLLSNLRSSFQSALAQPNVGPAARVSRSGAIAEPVEPLVLQPDGIGFSASIRIAGKLQDSRYARLLSNRQGNPSALDETIARRASEANIKALKEDEKGTWSNQSGIRVNREGVRIRVAVHADKQPNKPDNQGQANRPHIVPVDPPGLQVKPPAVGNGNGSGTGNSGSGTPGSGAGTNPPAGNTGTGTNPPAASNGVTLNSNGNTLSTGQGQDQVVVNGSTNKVNTGNETDTVVVNGSTNKVDTGNGADTVAVNGNRNVITGGNGNDTFTIAASASGNAIQGGNGDDTAIFDGTAANYAIRVKKNKIMVTNTATGSKTTLRGVENITFSQAAAAYGAQSAAPGTGTVGTLVNTSVGNTGTTASAPAPASASPAANNPPAAPPPAPADKGKAKPKKK